MTRNRRRDFLELLSCCCYSLADEVTPFPDISDVVQAQQKASITTTYLIPAELRVPHVSLLKYLGDEKYMGYVDKFIGE